MEVVALVGILFFFGGIWWELRTIRNSLRKSGIQLDQQIVEGPSHHVRVEYQSQSGFATQPSSIVNFRNPQVRAAQYRRTHVEKLREEERQRGKGVS